MVNKTPHACHVNLRTNCVNLEKAKIYTKSKTEALMNICEMPMSKKQHTVSKTRIVNVETKRLKCIRVYSYMEFKHKILFCK